MKRFSLRDLIWAMLVVSALLGFAVERYKRMSEKKVSLILFDQDGRKYATFEDVSDLDMGYVSIDPDEVQLSKIQVIISFDDE